MRVLVKLAVPIELSVELPIHELRRWQSDIKFSHVKELGGCLLVPL